MKHTLYALTILFLLPFSGASLEARPLKHVKWTVWVQYVDRISGEKIYESLKESVPDSNLTISIPKEKGFPTLKCQLSAVEYPNQDWFEGNFRELNCFDLSTRISYNIALGVIRTNMKKNEAIIDQEALRIITDKRILIIYISGDWKGE